MHVHHDMTIGIARGTSDDLEERGLGTEESDFFCIEYRDK